MGILHNGRKPDAAMPSVYEEGLRVVKSTFSGEEGSKVNTFAH